MVSIFLVKEINYFKSINLKGTVKNSCVLQQIKPDVRPVAFLNLLVYLVFVAVFDIFALIFYNPINRFFQNFSVTFWLALLVFDFLVILVGMLRFVRLYWYRRFHTYVISDDSLNLLSGVLSKKEFRIPYNNISAVEVILPFSLRIFNLGVLRVETNDRNRYFLHFIRNPKAVADLILGQVRAEEKQTKDMAETLRRIEDELKKE